MEALIQQFMASLMATAPGMAIALPERAARFAAMAHGEINQQRKYGGGPYVTHPMDVALMVATVTSSEAAIAAALLHDVVEDTERTLEEIRLAFGDQVATLVDELTDKSGPQDGNRSARKAKDRERLARASADAQTVKLADLISNSRSILANDPNFAKVYLKEKEALLAVMTRGNPILMRKARDLLEQGFSQFINPGGATRPEGDRCAPSIERRKP